MGDALAAEDVSACAAALSAKLDNEPNLEQLQKVVEQIGDAGASELAEIAIRLNAIGGALTTKGNRRRTLGGVFFFLAAQHPIARKAWPHIPWGYRPNGSRGSRPLPGNAQEALQASPWSKPMPWEEAVALTFDEKGEVNNVKIILTGKPSGTVRREPTFVAFTLTHAGKPPALPKGLPVPADLPTDYLIFVGLKQWRKVEDSLAANHDDFVIVEGWCALDMEVERICVWTTNVTTRKLQEAKAEKSTSPPSA